MAGTGSTTRWASRPTGSTFHPALVPPQNYMFNGGYIQLAYTLTGENRAYDKRGGTLAREYFGKTRSFQQRLDRPGRGRQSDLEPGRLGNCRPLLVREPQRRHRAQPHPGRRHGRRQPGAELVSEQQLERHVRLGLRQPLRPARRFPSRAHERLRIQGAVPILTIGANGLACALFSQETIAMRKYLFGLIGLVLLGGSPLRGQSPACGSEATCGAEAGCNASCDGCPQCGCRLVPVCHVYCTTKKVTEYKYRCVCEDICIPGVTPICKRGATCDSSGECAGGCDAGNNGCQEGCAGRCTIREVRKLVKYPVTKEVPVRKCTEEWTCPKCGHCGCGSTSAPLRRPLPRARSLRLRLSRCRPRPSRRTSLRCLRRSVLGRWLRRRTGGMPSRREASGGHVACRPALRP